MCKIGDQCKFDHEARHPKPVLWDNPERDRVGKEVGGVQDGGTHIYPWLIHVDIWQKPSQYCKVFIFQLTKLKKF